MNTRYLFAHLLTCACLYGQNVVTDWATIITNPTSTPPKSPPVQYLIRATVHLAMYDAAVSVQGGYSPYSSVVRAPAGTDIRAAVATAAYRAARPYVDPAQARAFETQYETYMEAIPSGEPKSRGIVAGQNAAASIQSLRADDGLSNLVLYECNSTNLPVGQFEPDGGCGTQPIAVNVGRIKPFTFADPTRFRTPGPDPLTSASYAADFTETRDYGRADSMIRTAEQTDIAYFWQAWNVHSDLVNLAVSRGLNVVEAARYFAMVYTAAADAGIVGFGTKYYYHLWRPRVAIPKADTDGNPDTDADPTWKPLISVNHPEYPSAHSFLTGAITDAMVRFFGTAKVTWTITSSKAAIPQLVKTERTHTNLHAIMRELESARVWAGLHWRHSMWHGADIGRQVARHVCDNFFQPAR